MGEGKPRVEGIDEFGFWLPFLVGAVTAACFAKEETDPRRWERSKWAGLNLARLMPAMSAALAVCRAHPDEFKRALVAECEQPIELEPMP